MPAGLFSTRLHQAIGLSPTDRELLKALLVTVRTPDNRESLCREGAVATHCAVVRDGFLASQKIVSDREQILGLHVPGDFADLQTLYMPILDHGIISICSSTVGLLTHSDLKDLIAASPSLASAFWRETIVEATLLREWICNVAARDALASLSHLFEIASRLNAVGLVANNSFYFPLTQQDLADATGLSSVHVNRTIQELRKRGLISWTNRTVTLPNFEELKRIGQFEPDYLPEKLA